MDVDYKKQAIEAFNTIQTNIGFLGIDNDIRRIMVTSSIKGEGKSTASTNIANAYAFAKKRVLLIDCDMRNPTVHRVLEVPNRTGLADLIMGSKEQVNVLEYITHFSKYLDILTAGHRPPNPTELLGSKRMGALLNQLVEEYDYVILDTPPVLIVPDAIALHPYVDAILQVVRHGFTTKEILEDSKKAWEVAGSKPTACIFNAIPDMQKRYSYYGYYDYMEDGKGKDKKNTKTSASKSNVKNSSRKSHNDSNLNPEEENLRKDFEHYGYSETQNNAEKVAEKIEEVTLEKVERKATTGNRTRRRLG